MRRLIVGLTVCSVLGWARAEDLEHPDWHTVEVAEGETKTLTAEELAAIGAETLVKTGRGTIRAGDEMADFAGDIRILDGFWDATTANAFGTADGKTYVNGGTILSRVYSPVTWTAEGGKPSYGAEAFVLGGTGCDGNGVIRALKECYNFAGVGGITLEEDILITGTHQLEFRYGTIQMNGHNVTVAMDKPDVSFRFVALARFLNPADFEVLSGRLGMESDVAGGTGDNAATIHSNATFWVNTLSMVQSRRLILKPGARLRLSNSAGTLGSIDNKTNLAGPIEIEGEGDDVPLDGEQRGKVFTLSGPITGARGIQARNGVWLQLANGGKDLTGRVGAEGVVGPDDLSVTGGVALVGLATLPQDGGGVLLTNAQLVVRNDSLNASNICAVAALDFPDLVVHGKSVVTSDMTFADITLRSLRKTGEGPLTLFGRYTVAGETDIAAGTLRFGSAVPQTPCGLNWSYVWNVGRDSGTAPAAAYSRGVDAQGARFGYRDWRATYGENGAASHNQSHWYTGYIKVPGEGASVACNFMCNMNRSCYVRIGDTVVVHMRDNREMLTGTVRSDYNRLYVGPRLELPTGWQPIFIHLANSWNSSSGPTAEHGWVANFGLGVDWEGRCETNSANYAKFLDPGDGSFLRPCAPDVPRAELEAGAFRPTFRGAVAFGPGAVFDIGDTAPYVPVEVPSLTGVPTVRNGAVAVKSATWCLRAGDLFDAAGRPRAKPLTIEATGGLAFPAGGRRDCIPGGGRGGAAGGGGQVRLPDSHGGGRGGLPGECVRAADGAAREGVDAAARGRHAEPRTRDGPHADRALAAFVVDGAAGVC